MPVENTIRIPREELLEILETEAPTATQRTTAPMPAVTLTDLLCIRDDELDDEPLAPPPPPVRRMRANTVPAQSRSAVHAVGTDPEIKALAAPIRLIAPTVFGVPIVAIPEPAPVEAIADQVTAAIPARLVAMPAQPPIFVPPVTTLQLRTLRPSRPLVIAASCLMTLLLALLFSLL